MSYKFKHFIPYFLLIFYVFVDGMANTVDPDQTASKGMVWSWTTLFVYAILSENLMYKILRL